MITVIIQGTSGIEDTVKSLEANSQGSFRVLVHENYRQALTDFYQHSPKIEFIKPTFFRRYGKKSDLYWLLRSGCLILTAAWDTRLILVKDKAEGKKYFIHPVGQKQFSATNLPSNIGKYEGTEYIVPILRVTETRHGNTH